MIDVKPTVLAALKANAALIALLGSGVRITQQVADSTNPFPRITFFEMENVDSLYVDDAAYASEIHIQIDIWSKGSTSAIASEVDTTMKSLNFKRDAAQDLYEDDTKIFHKAMRFSTNKPIGSD